MAYEKRGELFTNNSLCTAVKKSSPHDQTNCLEGYHSVINQFAPKMLAYSYLGIYCRYSHRATTLINLGFNLKHVSCFYVYRTILAALHFNYNLHRTTKEDSAGNKKLVVIYPKFKGGEGTVHEVKGSKNFGRSHFSH